MKILIVEDTEDSRVMLEMAVTSTGSEVMSAVNGVEALLIARRTPPDLIISDIMMPEMDGFELCREIKADPELKNIPFVFYTATYTERQDEELAMAIGASRFVLKPMEPKAFMAIIQEVLTTSQVKELPVSDGPLKEEYDLEEMHRHTVSRKLDKKLRELKQERAALQESEEKFRAIFESSHDAIMLLDDTGFFDCNKATLMIFGCKTREEFLGSHPAEWSPPMQPDGIASREAAEQNIAVALREGERFFVWTHIRADKKEFSAEVLLTSLKLGGKMVLQSTVRDITEREALQAQLIQAQKMESVGQLAGGVAHDFNNMLGVILGYVDMAMAQVDPDQQLFSDLQEIRTAANRSATLTRKLLTFARKQAITPVVLDLNNTMKEMLKMLRRIIGEDIDLAWIPCEGLWPVKMDPAQIDQILANLCVNSRDAIAGVGKMSIETENVTFDKTYCAAHPEVVFGEYVLMAVSDDGCGMDKEVLDKLFEPFFTTKEIGRGTGIGLATVYGIVKQNNGFITVNSEPGKGTIFKIYLARHKGKPGQIEKERSTKQIRTGNETILVVEDESAIREITKKMLESYGYTVLTAATPGEAIRLAEMHSSALHLLLTDMVMPGMNGRDLAGNILARYPKIKCLFMSGYSADMISHRGVLSKDVHFIQKPFTRQDLAEKVREALDNG